MPDTRKMVRIETTVFIDLGEYMDTQGELADACLTKAIDLVRSRIDKTVTDDLAPFHWVEVGVVQ